METIRIKGKITKKQLEEINKTIPEILEISNAEMQDIETLYQLNPKIKIRIVDDTDDKEVSKIYKEYYIKTLYTPKQLCEIIERLREIEKRIRPEWSDLEVSLYTYIELIRSIEHTDDDRLEENLLGIVSGKTNSIGFATIYKKMMDRLGIPCRILTNRNIHAWNEIMIDGQYYPLDIGLDAIFYRSKESEGKIGICNFLTDKEFYLREEHKTDEKIETGKFFDEEKIQKALEVISYDRGSQIKIQRPTIRLKSDELSKIFKNEEISEESLKIEPIKISITKKDFQFIKSDLAQISRYYPEILRDVELENTTTAPINTQEIVNEIYKERNNYPEADKKQIPINITISSSFEEDFDLDFSNAPEINYDNAEPVDGVEKQKIILKNLSGTIIKLPSLKGKISKNISELSVNGFDLSSLDIKDAKLEKISIESSQTKNIDLINGIEEIPAVSLSAVTVTEFNNFINRIFSTNSDIHELEIRNQDFHNRKILQELSINPNLTRLTINNSKVNDIDGLELFNGRLGLLALWNNDITVSDLDRLNAFWNNNPYISMYLNSNYNIRSAIQNASEISDESYNLMSDILVLSGTTGREDKVRTVDRLLWDHPDIPYYIKDANIIRGNLRITKNPMMLENDNEIDTVDFNQNHLIDGILLLSITQIEKLLLSNKVISQDVRIKINDVSELSSVKARELLQRMQNKGMNLSGVQILDENIDNKSTQITPYNMSQYIYIRDTLDLVINGINPNESDIDKFATIYQRLMDSIVYDHPACKHNDKNEALYHAEKLNSSRNLLEGLEEGKCVCAGYADILRNALALVGIESRINSGRVRANNPDTAHAWNQVQLDDGNGNKKWYYTDLTWDANNGGYDYTLLGRDNFVNNNHELTVTQQIENIEQDDYDRIDLRRSFEKARKRSFNFKDFQSSIDIPEDPEMGIEILEQDKITREYRRRKNDMYAKFYGNKEYQEEYGQRNTRYRQHEIQITNNGITYRTIEDYPEREKDEEFLLLDKYKECLERLTRYQAGDLSVYQGTYDQIQAALDNDMEYVETRNHTFDQNKNTYKDLATLGKYGERLPYLPKQNGVLKNVFRVAGNVGIFTKNLVSPVYKILGKYVAQPIHKLVTKEKDASPYKNNFYHRMVARRDYFEELNNTQNPRRAVRNFIKTRTDAIFKAKEGNEAVLRAGAADIKENIINQEKERVLIQNLARRSAEFDAQILQLRQEITNKPNAININDVNQALQNKINERDRINNLINQLKNNTEGVAQTDAVSDKQHAVASKEVNTARVTVIKGVVKGMTAKYVGPKIHDWLLERGKITKQIEVLMDVPETKKKWIEPTYKNEMVPVYEDMVDTGKSMSDIIGANKGKDITGFYSVYGGERAADTYKILGDEKITAIFQSKGLGGTGLSDTVGLKAPTFTNNTFATDLLDANGLLNQETTIAQLVDALSAGKFDISELNDLYVSVGDEYWTKLSDLVGDMITKVKVGEKMQQVVDVAGHYETYTEIVKKAVKTTQVITNPTVKKVVDIGGKMGKGLAITDSILDIAENLRKTNSNAKNNKKQPRNYTFDEDIDDIPKSKREYDKER